jgi:hypothetical protein
VNTRNTHTHTHTQHTHTHTHTPLAHTHTHIHTHTPRTHRTHIHTHTHTPLVRARAKRLATYVICENAALAVDATVARDAVPQELDTAALVRSQPVADEVVHLDGGRVWMRTFLGGAPEHERLARLVCLFRDPRSCSTNSRKCCDLVVARASHPKRLLLGKLVGLGRANVRVRAERGVALALGCGEVQQVGHDRLALHKDLPSLQHLNVSLSAKILLAKRRRVSVTLTCRTIAVVVVVVVV